MGYVRVRQMASWSGERNSASATAWPRLRRTAASELRPGRVAGAVGQHPPLLLSFAGQNFRNARIEAVRSWLGRVLQGASSIDVAARLTPLDPPGKPAAPPNPVAPCCGRRGLRHDRIPRERSSREPRAGERYGDVWITGIAGARRSLCLGGWPVNPQARSTCNVRVETGPAIGWAWVSAFSCQLVLASSAVVGAVCAAGRSLPAMKLAFALMAAIIGSTGSWVTLSHGL